MNPVTGPFTESISSTNAYVSNRSWYRQKRPYDLVLPYSKNSGRSSNSQGNGAQRYALMSQDYVQNATAYASAYRKLVEGLGDNAGIGITLAQWKQADGMISNRVNQLRRFNYHLVARNPIGVAASLGLRLNDVRKMMQTRYGTARKLSDLWLEFWFGWKPMVLDVYTACEVFDNFIPWAFLQGKGKASGSAVQDGGPFGEHIHIGWNARCRVGVKVRLVNPNLRLMQQFGILNPAAVAFDAIPWSFVLGWFSNVDSWLGSFTDFAGYDVEGGYLVRKAEVTGRIWRPDIPEYGGAGYGITHSRTVLSTIPRPAFILKDLSLKPARALTAISLLVQKLPR